MFAVSIYAGSIRHNNLLFSPWMNAFLRLDHTSGTGLEPWIVCSVIRIDPPAEEEIIFINENRRYIYIVYNQLTKVPMNLLSLRARARVCVWTNIWLIDRGHEWLILSYYVWLWESQSLFTFIPHLPFKCTPTKV